MAGVRMGERILHVGVGDPRLFTAMAAKVGLTGRACAVADNAVAVSLLERAAADHGVLVEVENAPTGSWPYEAGSFDLAVLDGNALLSAAADERLVRLSDTLKATRPGGRALVICRKSRGLLARLGFESARHGPSAPARALVDLLQQAGYGPARVLAEREGLVFVEGFRPAVI